MKRLISRIVGAGCLAAMLAAPVLAQEDPGGTNRDLELSEDMEIMGRLLEEALEIVYRDPKIGWVRSVDTPKRDLAVRSDRIRIDGHKVSGPYPFSAFIVPGRSWHRVPNRGPASASGRRRRQRRFEA